MSALSSSREPDVGYIEVTTQGGIQSFLAPIVEVNGRRVVMPTVGPRKFSVTPGATVIDARMPAIWGGYDRSGTNGAWGSYGAARLECEVRRGTTVPVFYAAPLNPLSPGQLGHEPQRAKGVAGFIALLAAPLVIAVGVFALCSVTIWAR